MRPMLFRRTYGVFVRTLRRHDTERIPGWSDSVVALVPTPGKNDELLKCWQSYMSGLDQFLVEALLVDVAGSDAPAVGSRGHGCSGLPSESPAPGGGPSSASMRRSPQCCQNAMPPSA